MVPGFRRGHVPKSVVKTRFRKELRDEVLAHILPHSLGDAIRENDLKVIGEPSIDNLKFGDDESIDVTFTIEVKPEFEISSYKSLPLTKRVYRIRDEDVEQTITGLREEHARRRIAHRHHLAHGRSSNGVCGRVHAGVRP